MFWEKKPDVTTVVPTGPKIFEVIQTYDGFSVRETHTNNWVTGIRAGMGGTYYAQYQWVSFWSETPSDLPLWEQGETRDFYLLMGSIYASGRGRSNFKTLERAIEIAKKAEEYYEVQWRQNVEHQALKDARKNFVEKKVWR